MPGTFVPTFLIGGGRDPVGSRAAHAPFVRAARGGEILCWTHDEPGSDPARWAGYLGNARVVMISAARPPALADLDGAAAVYVAGGLTPAYLDLLAPLAGELRGLPYAGYSAGAAIAADRAIVGGWRIADRAVCPQDASEDMDEVAALPGLGRVPFAVDVHASQWGTLGRAINTVSAGIVEEAIAIDEHTCVEVNPDGGIDAIHGSGAAYRISEGRIQVLTA